MQTYIKRKDNERRSYIKSIYNRQTGKTEANKQRLVGLCVGLVLLVLSVIYKYIK